MLRGELRCLQFHLGIINRSLSDVLPFLPKHKHHIPLISTVPSSLSCPTLTPFFPVNLGFQSGFVTSPMHPRLQTQRFHSPCRRDQQLPRSARPGIPAGTAQEPHPRQQLHPTSWPLCPRGEGTRAGCSSRAAPCPARSHPGLTPACPAPPG